MTKKISALTAVSSAAGANEIEVNEAGTTKKATLTQVGELLVSDTAYDATTWNGVTTVAPSKNAVRDLYEALLAGVSSSFDTLAEIATAIGTKAASGANTDITSLAGTATNDNAAAGKIGELIESALAVGTPVSLTSPSAANVTSISLTAGDWDVWGTVGFLPNAATTMAVLSGGINTTSATLPAFDTGVRTRLELPFTTGGTQGFFVGQRRLSLSGTTTVYLIAAGTFAVNTLAAYGYIGARRVR